MAVTTPITEKQYSLAEKIDATPEVLILRFKPQDGQPQAFDPGMFMMISGVDKTTGQKVIGRAFSIASDPSSPDMEFFVIKEPTHGEHLGRSHFMDAQVGDPFMLRGPNGQFRFDPSTDKKVMFIAGGTGLAPFVSMARHIKMTNAGTDVILLYSVKYPTEIILKGELEQLAKDLKAKLVVTVTRPQGQQAAASPAKPPAPAQPPQQPAGSKPGTSTTTIVTTTTITTVESGEVKSTTKTEAEATQPTGAAKPAQPQQQNPQPQQAPQQPTAQPQSQTAALEQGAPKATIPPEAAKPAQQQAPAGPAAKQPGAPTSAAPVQIKTASTAEPGVKQEDVPMQQTKPPLEPAAVQPLVTQQSAQKPAPQQATQPQSQGQSQTPRPAVQQPAPQQQTPQPQQTQQPVQQPQPQQQTPQPQQTQQPARPQQQVKASEPATQPGSQTWTGETGHIDSNMIGKYCQDLGERAFYICGPIAFVKAVKEALISLNVPGGRIKADVWG